MKYYIAGLPLLFAMACIHVQAAEADQTSVNTPNGVKRHSTISMFSPASVTLNEVDEELVNTADINKLYEQRQQVITAFQGEYEKFMQIQKTISTFSAMEDDTWDNNNPSVPSLSCLLLTGALNLSKPQKLERSSSGPLTSSKKKAGDAEDLQWRGGSVTSALSRLSKQVSTLQKQLDDFSTTNSKEPLLQKVIQTNQAHSRIEKALQIEFFVVLTMAVTLFALTAAILWPVISERYILPQRNRLPSL